ncbi:hypothetical protein BESB_034240 [Besnoitia besnoiti]|uniref:Uncharacterized protein n=1 Tax=Besnoitia besnoiti TaxID=94643 RepID=A0A2A9MLP3_BESBE|nr:hypothetical protein BESB_034240 [Besnoitia besnoiti]PFH36966.1 hypothetical protein BESB_034240 [Besnoitia besnoiti]
MRPPPSSTAASGAPLSLGSSSSLVSDLASSFAAANPALRRAASSSSSIASAPSHAPSMPRQRPVAPDDKSVFAPGASSSSSASAAPAPASAAKQSCSSCCRAPFLYSCDLHSLLAVNVGGLLALPGEPPGRRQTRSGLRSTVPPSARSEAAGSPPSSSSFSSFSSSYSPCASRAEAASPRSRGGRADVKRVAASACEIASFYDEETCGDDSFVICVSLFVNGRRFVHPVTCRPCPLAAAAACVAHGCSPAAPPPAAAAPPPAAASPASSPALKRYLRPCLHALIGGAAGCARRPSGSPCPYRSSSARASASSPPTSPKQETGSRAEDAGGTLQAAWCPLAPPSSPSLCASCVPAASSIFFLPFHVSLRLPVRTSALPRDAFLLFAVRRDFGGRGRLEGEVEGEHGPLYAVGILPLFDNGGRLRQGRELLKLFRIVTPPSFSGLAALAQKFTMPPTSSPPSPPSSSSSALSFSSPPSALSLPFSACGDSLGGPRSAEGVESREAARARLLRDFQASVLAPALLPSAGDLHLQRRGASLRLRAGTGHPARLEASQHGDSCRAGEQSSVDASSRVEEAELASSTTARAHAERASLRHSGAFAHERLPHLSAETLLSLLLSPLAPWLAELLLQAPAAKEARPGKRSGEKGNRPHNNRERPRVHKEVREEWTRNGGDSEGLGAGEETWKTGDTDRLASCEGMPPFFVPHEEQASGSESQDGDDVFLSSFLRGLSPSAAPERAAAFAACSAEKGEIQEILAGGEDGEETTHCSLVATDVEDFLPSTLPSSSAAPRVRPSSWGVRTVDEEAQFSTPDAGARTPADSSDLDVANWGEKLCQKERELCIRRFLRRRRLQGEMCLRHLCLERELFRCAKLLDMLERGAFVSGGPTLDGCAQRRLQEEVASILVLLQDQADRLEADRAASSSACAAEHADASDTHPLIAHLQRRVTAPSAWAPPQQHSGGASSAKAPHTGTLDAFLASLASRAEPAGDGRECEAKLALLSRIAHAEAVAAAAVGAAGYLYVELPFYSLPILHAEPRVVVPSPYLPVSQAARLQQQLQTQVTQQTQKHAAKVFAFTPDPREARGGEGARAALPASAFSPATAPAEAAASGAGTTALGAAAPSSAASALAGYAGGREESGGGGAEGVFGAASTGRANASGQPGGAWGGAEGSLVVEPPLAPAVVAKALQQQFQKASGASPSLQGRQASSSFSPPPAGPNAPAEVSPLPPQQGVGEGDGGGADVRERGDLSAMQRPEAPPAPPHSKESCASALADSQRDVHGGETTGDLSSQQLAARIRDSAAAANWMSASWGVAPAFSTRFASSLSPPSGAASPVLGASPVESLPPRIAAAAPPTGAEGVAADGGGSPAAHGGAESSSKAPGAKARAQDDFGPWRAPEDEAFADLSVGEALARLRAGLAGGRRPPQGVSPAPAPTTPVREETFAAIGKGEEAGRSRAAAPERPWLLLDFAWGSPHPSGLLGQPAVLQALGEGPSAVAALRPHGAALALLDALLRSPSRPLLPSEKMLLWKYRQTAVRQPGGLAKLLDIVDFPAASASSARVPWALASRGAPLEDCSVSLSSPRAGAALAASPQPLTPAEVAEEILDLAEDWPLADSFFFSAAAPAAPPRTAAFLSDYLAELEVVAESLEIIACSWGKGSWGSVARGGLVVRAAAVRALEKIRDDVLELFLMQLVQGMRLEQLPFDALLLPPVSPPEAAAPTSAPSAAAGGSVSSRSLGLRRSARALAGRSRRSGDPRGSRGSSASFSAAPLTNFLIRRCMKSAALAVTLFWCLQCEKEDADNGHVFVRVEQRFFDALHKKAFKTPKADVAAAKAAAAASSGPARVETATQRRGGGDADDAGTGVRGERLAAGTAAADTRPAATETRSPGGRQEEPQRREGSAKLEEERPRCAEPERERRAPAAGKPARRVASQSAALAAEILGLLELQVKLRNQLMALNGQIRDKRERAERKTERLRELLTATPLCPSLISFSPSALAGSLASAGASGSAPGGPAAAAASGAGQESPAGLARFSSSFSAVSASFSASASTSLSLERMEDEELQAEALSKSRRPDGDAAHAPEDLLDAAARFPLSAAPAALSAPAAAAASEATPPSAAETASEKRVKSSSSLSASSSSSFSSSSSPTSSSCLSSATASSLALLSAPAPASRLPGVPLPLDVRLRLVGVDVGECWVVRSSLYPLVLSCFVFSLSAPARPRRSAGGAADRSRSRRSAKSAPDEPAVAAGAGRRAEGGALREHGLSQPAGLKAGCGATSEGGAQGAEGEWTAQMPVEAQPAEGRCREAGVMGGDEEGADGVLVTGPPTWARQRLSDEAQSADTLLEAARDEEDAFAAGARDRAASRTRGESSFSVIQSRHLEPARAGLRSPPGPAADGPAGEPSPGEQRTDAGGGSGDARENELAKEETFSALGAAQPRSATCRGIVKKKLFLYKVGDDLRQDMLVLGMLRIVDGLLKQYGLDLKFTPYRVVALSTEDGLIEFLHGAESLSSIKKKYRTLINYFIHLHPDPDSPYGFSEKVWHNFIRSCAGSSLVTFLLGIGDRHLDNILVSLDGRLSHIDFGFILGEDPKPFPPPMKICSEMLEVMGGIGGKGYTLFVAQCCQAYKILRRHAKLLCVILDLMVDSGIKDIKKNLVYTTEVSTPSTSPAATPGGATASPGAQQASGVSSPSPQGSGGVGGDVRPGVAAGFPVRPAGPVGASGVGSGGTPVSGTGSAGGATGFPTAVGGGGDSMGGARAGGAGGSGARLLRAATGDGSPQASHGSSTATSSSASYFPSPALLRGLGGASGGPVAFDQMPPSGASQSQGLGADGAAPDLRGAGVSAGPAENPAGAAGAGGVRGARRRVICVAVAKVKEKLRLDLDDADAERYLVGVINSSARALFPAVVDKLHEWALYWR